VDQSVTRTWAQATSHRSRRRVRYLLALQPMPAAATAAPWSQTPRQIRHASASVVEWGQAGAPGRSRKAWAFLLRLLTRGRYHVRPGSSVSPDFGVYRLTSRIAVTHLPTETFDLWITSLHRYHKIAARSSSTNLIPLSLVQDATAGGIRQQRLRTNDGRRNSHL